MKKTRIVIALAALALITALPGCTVMIGRNDVEHLAPRGSYRSVDSSGTDAEALLEMDGGGQVDATVPLTQ